MLGWPNRCKLAHAFLWENSNKRLKLAPTSGPTKRFSHLGRGLGEAAELDDVEVAPALGGRVVQKVRCVGHRLREVLPYDAVDLRERFAGVRPASQRVDSVRHLVFRVAVPRCIVSAVRHQAMDRCRRAAWNLELGEIRVGEANL
jgi:hypothetical protein